MKLNELIGIRNPIAGATGYIGHMDIDDFMRQSGFDQIGSGSRATVWGRDNLNYVIKIFDDDDFGYIAFLRYALQHPDIPYLPKIIGKPKQLTKLGPRFWFVRMEKLTPSSDDVYYLISDTIRSVRTHTGFKDTYAERYAEMQRSNELTQQQYPGLIQIITDLDAICEKSNGRFGFDMVSENVMMRGSVPVLTDPLQ